MKRTQAILRKTLFVLVLLVSSGAVADIVVVVNATNPINSLKGEDVKRIFLGRVGAFPQTGQPMKVLDQTRDSDEYKRFYEEIIGFKLRHLKRYRAAYVFSGKGAIPEVTGRSEDVKTFVESNLNAIGYIDSKHLDGSVKVVYPR